ncbi:MAG: leucine-rich repeat domain-containing protein [Candidatus Poribacteria bacterium]|nr:leucine-rich repeat domain-containing protein [Candidatus Poribacteria bacterium]
MKRFCRLFLFLIVLSGWIPHLAAAQVVNMPDENLAALVRESLRRVGQGLAPDAPITRQALQSFAHLTDFSDWSMRRKFPIKDLTGLEHATQLVIADLAGHDIRDLGPLKGLRNLKTLYLSSNKVSDLGPLAGLTQLSTLFIGSNPINDFSPLAGLTQLRSLSVTVRSVASMNNLLHHVDLTQLKSLYIYVWSSQIGDLGPFGNLTQLKHFDFTYAQIRDVTPLAGLTQLERLDLTNNEIRDVTPLAGLTQLTHLGLWHNQVSDVTPLANLTQLKDLILGDNEIRDVTPLAGLTQLRFLNLRNNQISDVTPIQHLIDSANTRVLLEGNPIDEQPEGGAGLVVTVVKAAHFGTANEKRFASPEQKFALYVTVQNQGTEQSDRTKLIFYRSTDRNITTDDQQVGDPMDVVPLAPQRSVTLTLYPVAPRTAGTYYYGACVVDFEGESKKGNNCSTKPAEITVTQLDLQITSIKVAKKGTSPHSLKDWKDTFDGKPGDAFDLRVRVLNNGKADAEATQVKFYRSIDAEISEDDTELPTKKNNRRLPPEATHTHIVTFRIPATGGVYYYGAKVEPVEYENNTGNNWSVGVRVGKEELEPPPNLISDVAFTQNSTYFIVNAQPPKLLIENQRGVTYGSCVITFDLPGVPDEPLQQWNENHGWLAGDPPYIMWELLSPRQQIKALEGKYDLDTTEVVIGGIATAIGIAVGAPIAQKVTQKVLPFIPLGPIARHTDKIAPGLIKIGSKFKVLIPASKRAFLLSKEGIAEKGRFVISKGIGALAKSAPQFGGGYLIGRGLKRVFTAGPEKEPTIEDELLAYTADPFLTLVPISGGNTPLPKKSRHLFRIPGAVTDIGITIEQGYFRKNAQGITEAFTAVYEGRRDLGNAGAPGIRAMSLADYPPFQYLPPEIQDYLRRDFGALMSAETRQAPETTALLPNYPNPFNPETWIPYQLAKPAEVSLTIYDIQGRVVRTLDLGHQRAGTYQGPSRAAYWDGKNAQGEPVASGPYFYTLKVGDFTATRKMLIRK